ncbi:MAG: BamA/TamA family outer membrane protein, partial [Vibrio sp.]
MKRLNTFVLSSVTSSLLIMPSIAYAAKSAGDVDITADPKNKKNVVVPFVFGTESIGASIGAGALFRGVGQEQASLLGAAFISTKHSYMYYFSANNYQLSHSWMLNGDGYQARFVDYDYYTGEATDNSSNENDSVEADGFEARYRLQLRYVLPLGAAEFKGAEAYYNPIRPYQGHLPWESGVTSLNFIPFYQERDLSGVKNTDLDTTWGAKVELEWDNRDDKRNPTQGSYSLATYTYAPDQGDQESWSTVELQNSHYWDLGAWDGIFDSQVFAFDFYTGISPNAGECDDGTCHQAPEYAGLRLGGLYHLRSYGSTRYTGNAAI